MLRYLIAMISLCTSICLVAKDNEIPLLTRPHSDIPPELQNLSYAVYPGDPDYNTDRFNYNQRFNIFPLAIIIPQTNQQVQFVVSMMKKYHLKFAVRSGRHCFEPGSLSPSYLIDLRNFSAVIPDIASEQVYIGAGAQLGTVIQTLGEIDYAIPTGTCPSVAVAGLTLGGGIGFLSRQYGLTCDSVVSITFVNANAEIIEVSASSHPELFWALLGAGNGSYGIVLGFTFKMHYIPIATYYELLWEFNPKLVTPIMTAWQKWVETLPDSISTVLGLRHHHILTAEPETTPNVVIRIHGIKVGPEPFTEWSSAFAPFNPEVKLFQGRYIDTAQFWAKATDFRFNKNQSKILTKPVSGKVMKTITRFFEKLEKENPDDLIYFNFEAFGGKIPQFHTSFYPRKAFGWWQLAYYWKHKRQSRSLLALSHKFYRNIPHEVSRYSYANVVDYDLGSHYLKAYYGSHVNKLIKIKQMYDPMNLFHWKQSIPPYKK